MMASESIHFFTFSIKWILSDVINAFLKRIVRVLICFRKKEIYILNTFKCQALVFHLSLFFVFVISNFPTRFLTKGGSEVRLTKQLSSEKD